MKLLVIGAGRGVGREFVELASGSRHAVTAFVRDRRKLPAPSPAVEVVEGDAMVLRDVERHCDGHDAVVCTLGADRPSGVNLYSKAAENLVIAMGKRGLSRLVFLSNFGVLGERSAHPLTALMLLAARAALRDTLADHRKALDIFAKSKLDWTAVRPMAMTNGKRTERYRVSVSDLPVGGVRISRRDVADFMLKQLESHEFVRLAPGLAY